MAIKEEFPFYKQLDAMDCGPTCLRMIARHYGKSFTLQTLRKRSWITREGVSLLGISEAAESVGMRTRGVRLPFEALQEITLPCVAHWRQSHFVVVYKIDEEHVHVADPAFGLIRYKREEFLDGWASTVVDGDRKGIALIVEPTPDFYSQVEESEKSSFKFLFSYLLPYKRYILQLGLGLFVGSILQLIFPFLTQAIVDFGIQNQDIGFVNGILIAQLILYFSQASVGFIRSWILLHVGARVNIAFISDFLRKLMRLPLSYFDSRLMGDLLQRIEDHHRLETFLTSTTLNVFFSIFNLLVFGVVLAWYSWWILLVFLVASVVSVVWILFFMKVRRALDFKRFDQMARNQSTLIQLIQGMPEIKLNGCENQKRWDWERVQTRLFRVSISGLVIDQYQQAGTLIVNNLKNILISYLAAKSVIDGHMTLGMMMSVQYIIGQLNSPIEQLIQFFHSAQDAKISLERMGEIYNEKDEDPANETKLEELPAQASLRIENLTFHYEGPRSPAVLKDVNLDIPFGKVTAIVGASGSGKTTLLKLLLKFYPPASGEIKVGDTNLEDLNTRLWRSRCGVVMQDGRLFNEEISHNIALGDENIDPRRLREAARIGNIQEYVQSLPLRYNTKVGEDGVSMSQGQKQRVLIARAAYRNPDYLFFDEATSSLDATNEKEIMDNLAEFCRGKTVVVIAHRLSTVKSADQIVVLDKGAIAEIGTHKELTEKRGLYYTLVKNQLELGA